MSSGQYVVITRSLQSILSDIETLIEEEIDLIDDLDDGRADGEPAPSFFTRHLLERLTAAQRMALNAEPPRGRSFKTISRKTGISTRDLDFVKGRAWFNLRRLARQAMRHQYQ